LRGKTRGKGPGEEASEKKKQSGGKLIDLNIGKI
jgi:hypothetical protein